MMPEQPGSAVELGGTGAFGVMLGRFSVHAVLVVFALFIGFWMVRGPLGRMFGIGGRKGLHRAPAGCISHHAREVCARGLLQPYTRVARFP